jgi:hypothetical protein
LKSQSTGGFAQIKSEHTNGDSHIFSVEQGSPKTAFAAAFAAASSPVPKRAARFQYTTPPKMIKTSTIAIMRMFDMLYLYKSLFFFKQRDVLDLPLTALGFFLIMIFFCRIQAGMGGLAYSN